MTIAGPSRGMYLVSGRDSSLETIVESKGGATMLRLNGHKLLVSLPFDGYISLKEHQVVSSIGPVTVDLNRLAQATEMLVKTANRPDVDSG